ncbi:hypothetical protein [Burkholderia phage BCSR5]|nr:hypothetical protein [Burkholderia phage BCSR5]
MNNRDHITKPYYLQSPAEQAMVFRLIMQELREAREQVIRDQLSREQIFPVDVQRRIITGLLVRILEKWVNQELIQAGSICCSLANNVGDSMNVNVHIQTAHSVILEEDIKDEILWHPV